jgi:adenosylcobinamide-phosphate synthase
MLWSGFHPALHMSSLPVHGVWLLAALCVSVLWLALWIDRRFGEPPSRLHPVVAMGHFLHICGRVTVRCVPVPAFVLGAVAWWTGVLLTGAAAWAVQAWALACLLRAASNAGGSSMLAALALTVVTAWLLKTMLSWRMLRDEAAAVERALGESLEAGRERLSWLVSRDTAQLTAAEVRESAIESLAENLNDSVVAPIFWFVLLGLPGAAVYRFANTADAMWGYRGIYRGQHWEWAGKWAAWADDVLSWLPARLTAALLVMVSRARWTQVAQQARKTPSPNSGWPMAAMALALDIRLGKPGVYVLNEGSRRPEPADTAAAQFYASKVLAALVLIAPVAIVLIAVGAAL